MSYVRIGIPTAVLAFAVATSATAQSTVVNGEGTFTLGYNWAEQADRDEFSDSDSVYFYELDGRVTTRFASGFILAFDAAYRFDDFGSGDGNNDFSDDEDPESQWQIGVHGLYQLSETSLVGGFLGYGDTNSQGNPSDEEYDVLMLGAEAQTFLAPDVLVFGQLGLGDKVRDTQNDDDQDEGFSNGGFLGFGMNYFPTEDSAFGVDFMTAWSRQYVDSNDPGRAYGFAFSYERRLNTAAPLVLSAFAAFEHYSSTDEGEAVDELQLGLGLTYLFGAGNLKSRYADGRALTTPYMPNRMGAWTEWAD